MARDLRGVAAATLALYVLQGLPLTVLLALSGISPADRSQEHNLLGPHAFWTSLGYVGGVLLFGAVLAVTAGRVRGRGWGTGSGVIAVAVCAYVMPPVVAAAADADAGQAGAYVTVLLVFTLAPLMSAWVAGGCAAIWFWRWRNASDLRRSADPVVHTNGRTTGSAHSQGIDQ